MKLNIALPRGETSKKRLIEANAKDVWMHARAMGSHLRDLRDRCRKGRHKLEPPTLPVCSHCVENLIKLAEWSEPSKSND